MDIPFFDCATFIPKNPKLFLVSKVFKFELFS